MSNRLLAPAALPFMILCALAGCAPRERQQPDTGAATAPPQAPLILTATDYAFQFPDTVAAGWVTVRLVNHGNVPHMAQLIRLDSAHTVEQYHQAYTEAFRTRGPRPEWARRLGGPTVTVPHDSSSATLFLEPGTYVWNCLYNVPDGIPHAVGHGMTGSFVVAGREEMGATRTAPTADVVIRLADYSFSLNPPLTAGRHVIKVENAGPEPHEVGLIRLAPGKTMQDFFAWLEKPGNTPPDSIGTVTGGTTSLAPGAEVWFEADLTPGEYLLLCFVTSPDGRSHIEQGMAQQITVPAAAQ